MGVNIKYGASTWLWTSPFQTSSVEELFSKISALGFDSVEIAVEDPSLVDVETVRLALQKYKLKAVVCGAFSTSRDLTSEDPNVQQNCFKYIETCLDLCVSWGVSIFAGPMYSAVGKARMVAHPHLVHEFISALIQERAPFPNARQLANITCLGILAHESAMEGGNKIRLPDFTLI